MMFRLLHLSLLSVVVYCGSIAAQQPNILFLLTDDHRWDGIGVAGNELIQTPNLDRLCESGTRFTNAFVTLAICSPSRAACLTGRYGSSSGVTSVGKVGLRPGEPTFANALKRAGYATGVTGKWHLKTTPQQCGFDFVSTCWSNGTWYDRRFQIDGVEKVMPGFVDDVAANESIRFIHRATKQGKPFVLWMNTQVPHMDHHHTWPAEERFLANYAADSMPLPDTWNDDLSGKPQYLKAARNRTQALKYGYDVPENIRNHTRDYYASVQQMDAAVGRVLDELDRMGLRDNTWIIFMGDNGWMLGEHGMTSKVLPYEESMRVPLAIAGPGTQPTTSDKLVLNIDVAATIYQLAGLPQPTQLHGRSLLPILQGTSDSWRTSFLYEAPTPQLGSKPLWAVRDHRWKYVETSVDETTVFRELYDLDADSSEATNVADRPQNAEVVRRLAMQLTQHRKAIGDGSTTGSQSATQDQSTPERKIPDQPPPKPRTDLFISGVYPHLTTYGIYSQNGAHFKSGHNECGIGAVVPWSGKLWMVNYAPHMPKGSEHKLYSIDRDPSRPLTIHPESVGGTPAGRMIHKESNQLLIAHYAIDAAGKVRVIQPADMPIRVTAIARHLTDPANKVYYVDMEGSIWEANVHTLEVKRLFKKPVPGWHGKGGYTSQGRLVISNNGELHVGNYNDLLVGGEATNEEERGVLAQWDGTDWSIVERKQFTEVTGPGGISGGSDGDDPIWSMGWDRRSVRLKLLEDGHWHTYLLPKAAYCNDASHGWYTEWPRIREITDGRWLMDMHGMFFDFPKTFSRENSKGLRPLGSHLRYIPDFCAWNERLVLATDGTSIQGNKLAGQPQSNLWFGDYQDLKTWGPANGYGGPWIEDSVRADVWSDPFLIDGFQNRCLHLAVGRRRTPLGNALRATDQQRINSMPDELAALPRVTVNRGDWHKAGAGYSFHVNQPVTVYLAVDLRGTPQLDPAWIPTELEIQWGKGFRDRVYRRAFSPGEIVIAANTTEHKSGSFGMPHTSFVLGEDLDLVIRPGKGATVTDPAPAANDASDRPVTFSIQIDREGKNQWSDFVSYELAGSEARSIMLPQDLDAVWLRLKTDRDCTATAFLCQTSSYPNATATQENSALFDALADINDDDVHSALVYAAKRNRNLRIIGADGQCFEFTKDQFQFKQDSPDTALSELLHVEPEFTVDEASVVIQSGGKRYRLPKGDAVFDQPFAFGPPRASREVQSERHLANIHGTFYEIPLITNGAPPAWNLMRPVASHRKQITDFCSWNGLLVLAGVKRNANQDGHLFQDPRLDVGLWFGAVDDLWKLGKPKGSGGPWRNSSVQSGKPSDPYLMTGYDQKRIKLSHQSQSPVTFVVQIDIDGKGLWVDYREFLCQPGQPITHQFPAGFSASWLRVIPSASTIATAQLEYR